MQQVNQSPLTVEHLSVKLCSFDKQLLSHQYKKKCMFNILYIICIKIIQFKLYHCKTLHFYLQEIKNIQSLLLKCQKTHVLQYIFV